VCATWLSTNNRASTVAVQIVHIELSVENAANEPTMANALSELTFLTN